MAITLITGLPGNAKTLRAMRHVIDLAAAENRAVYYAGLKQLKVGDPRLKGTTWIELDPLTWHESVPSGSIIFIDECQKVFRSRSLGAVPPKHVTELEEHRHKGLDFVMVTQHPSLVDPAVRKLTQTHMHLVRIWGMEATTVHRWDAVRDNCDKPSARKDSESVKWVFDKSLYGLYHSADVHTMKRRIPGRVKLLVAVPFLVAGLGYVAYTRLHKLNGKPEAPASASASSAGARPGHGGPRPTGGPSGAPAPASSSGAPAPDPRAVTDPEADLKAYVALRTPRVAGFPETAPRYDQLTTPVRVPVPAMCIAVGDLKAHDKPVGCRCYSQQGTPMEGVETNTCLQLALGGRFMDFDADPARASGGSAGSVAPPSSPLVVSR